MNNQNIEYALDKDLAVDIYGCESLTSQQKLDGLVGDLHWDLRKSIIKKLIDKYGLTSDSIKYQSTLNPMDEKHIF